jgi:hypothetical protein
MDADLIMSATAGASAGENVLQADYWRAFAPITGRSEILTWVSDAVEKPHLSLRSEVEPGAALRARFEGRLGLAGVIRQGKVPIAFPLVKGGDALEVEVIEVMTGANGIEGWVIGETEGVRFGFYDVLHAAYGKSYQAGQRHRFVVNALALSLKRVKPFLVPSDPDGDLLPICLSNLRTYVLAKTGRPDRGVFQSPVEADTQSASYAGLAFEQVPVSLGHEDGVRVTIDLFVGPDVMEAVGSPLRPHDELAGSIWLQGYAADKLTL